MTPTVATFAFELLNFLLLAALAGWLLFKPVRASLRARQDAARQHAADLAAKTADVDRLHAEWEHKRAALDAEATQLRSTRLAAAETEAAAIVAAAKAAADREHAAAAKALAHLEQAEIDSLAEAVAAVVRDGVAGLLSSIGGPELDRSLVGAACRQVQALDAPSLGDVLIESARPLADGDRAALMGALGARASSCAVRVAPDIGAGVRVTSSRGLVDASAAGVAADAARRLKETLASGAAPQVTA